MTTGDGTEGVKRSLQDNCHTVVITNPKNVYSGDKVQPSILPRNIKKKIDK